MPGQARRRLVVESVHARLDVRVTGDTSIRARVRATPPRTAGDVRIVHDAASELSIRPAAGEHADPGDPADLEIVVDVPLGTEVVLRGITGKATIGDTEGAVELDLRGDVRVRAGRIGETSIRAASFADIDIADVRGRLDLTAAGSVRARVRGDVMQLLGRVSGSANVAYGGSADEAVLDVDGPGHISVHRVRYSLRRTCVGSGDAVVAIPPALDAERSSRHAPSGIAAPVAAR